MDTTEATPERADQPVEIAGFSPLHHWAKPDTRMDLLAVKPHACMERIQQVGNYIHCFNGNHGMRLGPHEILVQKDGIFSIESVNVLEVDKKGKVLQPKQKRAKL